jgi:muramoyltetrapeptide carboxypeptidase
MKGCVEGILCFDFPVGHQKNNFALKCGVRHELTVKVDGVGLREGDGLQH